MTEILFARLDEVVLTDNNTGLSVLGVTLSTPGAVADIVGTTDQVLRVAQDGLSLTFGAINLASTAAVTNTLAAANGGTGNASYVLGDTLYASGVAALARLAGNTTTTRKYIRQTGNGTVSAAPVWDTILAADIPGSAMTANNDTNVTLSLGGTPATSLLAATSLTLGWTGTLAAARLNANVVQAITNDTNVTGSIAAQTLTLGWTSTLATARGGTGIASPTAHDLLIGNGSSALTQLAPSATSGVPLVSQGASSDPAYGTATVAGGGTGATTLASSAVLYGNGTSPIQALPVNSSATNKFLTQVSSGAPAWATIVASDLPGAFSGFANPTNPGVNLTGSNGSATTALRSDVVHVLDQSITPVWTGKHAWTIARTIASSAGASWGDVSIPASTTTLTGTTTVTLLAKFAMDAPTLTDASGVTVTDAASFFIGGAPIAAGSVTITNPWAIYVVSGNVKFPGTGNVLGTITSGTWNGTTIATANGGTGIASPTAHGLLIANGASALTQLAPSATSGVPLISQGASSDPAYGTAVVAGGGTGAVTLASNGMLYGNGTSAVQALAVNASGTNKFLTQSSSAAPAWGVIAASDLPGSFAGFANPTNPGVNLSGSNGSAATAMRSDAVLVLDQTIAPTWTGQHIHTVARTIASSTGAALDDVKVAAATTTITGNTGSPITLLAKVGLYQPTLTDASAVTVTNAATLYIDNAPLAAGSVTLTNAWALLVGAGNAKFAGHVSLEGVLSTGATGTGKLVFDGTPTIATPSFTTGFTIGGAAASGNVARGNGTNFVSSTLAIGDLSTIAAYSLVGNTTNGSAVPVAFTVGSLTQKASPGAGDFVLIQDESASHQMKYATVASISAAGSVASIAGNTGAFTLSNGITNSTNDIRLASIADQRFLANFTGGSAVPVATAISSIPVFAVLKVQTFTSSGTYTPSTGMKYCMIECVGSGGGGGGTAAATSSLSNGAGGGAGSYSRAYSSAATIGGSQTVTVGAAGTAGAAGNNAGGAGGDVSVGTICIAKGGSGGGGAFGDGGPATAGLGGVAGTGDFTGTGAPGFPGNGAAILTVYIASGHGGPSIFGGGGRGGIATGTTFTGGAGTLYGGGGGGASSQNSGTAAGGAGAKGVVIITEFTNQ